MEMVIGNDVNWIILYFLNLLFGMVYILVEGCELEFLLFFVDGLLFGVIEGYFLFVIFGFEVDCSVLCVIIDQFEVVGWIIVDGKMVNVEGMQFSFDILLNLGVSEFQVIGDLYV